MLTNTCIVHAIFVTTNFSPFPHLTFMFISGPPGEAGDRIAGEHGGAVPNGSGAGVSFKQLFTRICFIFLLVNEA